MLRYVIALLFLAGSGAAANVAGPILEGGRTNTPQAVTEPITLDYSPPANVRQWYYNHGNPDADGYRDREGDCVQVSLGMHGVKCNNIKAALVPFDSPYGEAIRGGSGPQRVADYCRQRNIKVYNITGRTVDDTYPWLVWAAETGRGAALGFGSYHFQFLCGRKPDGTWLVCDNNTPWQVDEYSDRDFRYYHAVSGPWVVILDGHAPPPPVVTVLERPKPRSILPWSNDGLPGGTQWAVLHLF